MRRVYTIIKRLGSAIGNQATKREEYSSSFAFSVKVARSSECDSSMVARVTAAA